MKQSRKDWIKNITIIFLAIMLVLTFFSNTIMNYSLPEVATDMVEPGTVTTKIRGTGTLEADDPYKVTIQESRVIASVAVKEGDVVEKDQVLFYLEDKESAELEAAEKKLDEMVLAYTTSLLAGEVSQQSYENIRSGNISSTGAYQSRINEAKLKVESAQAAVDSAQATVDSLSKQIAIAGVGSNDLTDKETALKNAEAAKSKSYENLTKMQAQLAAVEAKYETKEKLKTNLNTAIKNTSEIKKEIEQKASYLYTELLKISEEDFIAKMDEGSESYKQKLTDQINLLGTPDKEKATDTLAILAEKYDAYKEAKKSQEAAQLAYDSESGADAKELEEARVDQENAQNHYNECAALVESLTNEINNNTANTTKQKADLEKAKIEAEAKVKDATTVLEAAKKELEQLLTDVSKELDLSSQSSAIREQQEEVERLREKSVGSTIVAPVAGTVNSISKTAGETTVPDEAIAVMQPEGKGYSMSFSVTNEQAQKVSVGEKAELQNAWYYDDVTATLTNIRPDTQNPGQKKLLYFSVTGNVQPGQSISLSIGQRSANYDLVVPNSAIREDSNGKFILIVESKNSPLGNRYVATRVDVEVLTSDDLNTAISAALYGYEYVITTANKPVEAGKQIRLADE